MENDIHDSRKKLLSKHGWITTKKSFKHGWTTFFAPAFLIFVAWLSFTVTPSFAAEAACLAQSKQIDLTKQAKAMRQDILDAVKTGHINSLQVVLEQSELWPMAQIGKSNKSDDGPIKIWVNQSQATEGAYILAQIKTLLNMAHLTKNITKGLDLYIWPYFAEADISKLCARELVDFLTLNTPQQWREMQKTGEYTGFQIAIGSDGSWHYLVRKNLAQIK